MDIRKGILKEEQGVKKENLGAEGFLEDIMIKRDSMGVTWGRKPSELKKKKKSKKVRLRELARKR